MRNISFIPCLAILILCGCASLTTTKLQPTDTVRDTTTDEKSAATRFQIRRQPSIENPNLEIAVERLITQEETFQRRYIEKRVLKPGTRAALWIGGAVLAGGGYYVMTETGLVRLGQYVTGLGAVIPLSGEIITASLPPVGEEWKEESRMEPASGVPLTVRTSNAIWTDTTDIQGIITVDISSLVDEIPFGQPLAIKVAVAEDTAQAQVFTIATEIVDLYRTLLTPIVGAAPEPPIESALTRHWPTIAILDFEGIGISDQEARVLTNRLGTHMVQLGRYQVIERGEMEQILTEQDFQLTGCTSDECAVEIGQLLGVQQMLAGSFGKLGEVYIIDMRIIDVQTGRILRTTSYDIEGSINRLLSEGLAEAVRRMAGAE